MSIDERPIFPMTRWIGTDEYEIWNERDLAEYEKRVAEHEEMNSQPLNKRLNSITPKHSGIIVIT
jgi:hypothetical protein